LQSILVARQNAERALLDANAALERKTEELQQQREMAPKVNKLTPEARYLSYPSRRLDRAIVWRSVHKGLAKNHPVN
jgi:hypothetical protein